MAPAAPRVSVLMPVFNTAPYLEASLESISGQSFTDFELVVIDDGSTDGSSAILARHAAREPRMRLVSRGNRGLIATRNELLASARGELVAWMDSDDRSAPERLGSLAAAFDADPALACVGSFAQCVDSDGARLNVESYPARHDDIVRGQLEGGGMRFPTTMMRRQLAIDVGGFREPFVIGEDPDLLLRIGEAGCLANVQQPLYFYRQHLSSVCATFGPRWSAFRREILALARERRESGHDRLQAGGTVSIEVEPGPPAAYFVARAHAYWSACGLANGDRALARKYAWRAVRARPARRVGWAALARAVFAAGPAPASPQGFALPTGAAALPCGEPTCDVSVILVSYNTRALLEPCLDRLGAALAEFEAQVIVVDNASRDGSAELLRARYGERLTLVENTVNVGFGRANNQVLGQVRGRFVLLLNTDAYVEPDAVSRAIAYMEAHPRCGVLGARLVGAGGQLQPSCRYFPTPWNVFLLHTGLHRFFPKVQMVDDMGWNHAAVRPCDWVPGCFYLVRREAIDAVGLFDPRFFLYYEEVDHCRAVKEAGWEVTYFPEVTVVHLGGESAKSDASLSAQGRQISSLQAESELLYFRKHHGLAGAWLALGLGWLAGIYIAVKGVVQRRGGEGAARAWRNALLMASVFRATQAGRRATR